MRRVIPLAFVLTLLATSAHAQGILTVSYNKCALDKQEQIRQVMDSLWLPIAQELVNEGKLTGAGSAYHAWGDEWNVVIWYTAPNITTFLAGFNELYRRMNQRHPDAAARFGSWCTEHKDSFYAMGKETTPAPAAGPGRPD